MSTAPLRLGGGNVTATLNSIDVLLVKPVNQPSPSSLRLRIALSNATFTCGAAGRV